LLFNKMHRNPNSGAFLKKLLQKGNKQNVVANNSWYLDRKGDLRPMISCQRKD